MREWISARFARLASRCPRHSCLNRVRHPGSKEHGYRLEQVAREPSIRHPVAPAVAAALATELGIPKKMQENQEKLSRNPNPPACHFVC